MLLTGAEAVLGDQVQPASWLQIEGSTIAAIGGGIRMVTIAPELTGALEAIELLHQRGVMVAIGHTDADNDLLMAAMDAGASVATQLLNCMPVMVKRTPGPAVALANDPRVSVELIADGVHIHPALIHLVGNTVGADRVVAVTDAIGAAGAADVEYLIGELAVTVTDGVARLTDSGALAGSTLTMDTALRTLVRQCQFALPDAQPGCPAHPCAAERAAPPAARPRSPRPDRPTPPGASPVDASPAPDVASSQRRCHRRTAGPSAGPAHRRSPRPQRRASSPHWRWLTPVPIPPNR